MGLETIHSLFPNAKAFNSSGDISWFEVEDVVISSDKDFGIRISLESWPFDFWIALGEEKMSKIVPLVNKMQELKEIYGQSQSDS